MPKPSDRELASLIQQYLDLERLLAEHPEIREADIDALWRRHGLAGSAPARRKPPRGLFDEAPAHERPSGGPGFTANCDGAARGNPGPAAVGVVLRDEDGTILAEISECIGRATSNVAEYNAVIRAAEEALTLGADQLTLLLDSELLVRQLQGAYRVRAAHLRPLYQRALGLLERLGRWDVHHVPRGQNAAADALANRALNRASPPPQPR